ncbi:DUF2605 domain-containing protein [Spirulina subsalsa]|uniref:DUF2605 domain-containing protein n=1 Tax=Spirulina subsalsa TaxID=54311 RepID=UPI0002DE66EF|nr:DUF2605 domain-containing protein [Spirulina subsalsa]
MSGSQPPENDLLKQILEPLLEDFQDWFGRSQTLLESQKIPFLTDQEQNQLLLRLQTAKKEVSAAQLLCQTMNHRVGIEMTTLIPWHRLVTECWQISRRWRAWQADLGNNNTTFS